MEPIGGIDVEAVANIIRPSPPMLNDRSPDAHSCQRAAYEWLALARTSRDERERTQLLAIADAWLQIAHDMYQRELSNTPTLH
jgi:hypothetical protein